MTSASAVITLKRYQLMGNAWIKSLNTNKSCNALMDHCLARYMDASETNLANRTSVKYAVLTLCIACSVITIKQLSTVYVLINVRQVTRQPKEDYAANVTHPVALVISQLKIALHVAQIFTMHSNQT